MSHHHLRNRRKMAHYRNLPASRRTIYTIAWMCALPSEMAAARAVMDDIHEPLSIQTDDNNTYLLGNVKELNIVIACLPANQYGTINAAIVMSNMKRTFTKIRICLLVGVGGGAPGSVDLRLGDIVVGTKVVQTDLGKLGRDGRLERTATPKILHQSLGTAISTLQAKHEFGSSRIPSILQQNFKEGEYGHPGLPDRLFFADYCHVLSTFKCDGCDDSNLVRRSPRISKAPIIHYGAIASGNQVIKDSAVRDKLARELNVICFEMEAAGLMDILPCLPIRGICDYSDSHKSKEWQRYAAATAAAYAKEFLEQFPIIEMHEEDTLGYNSEGINCSPPIAHSNTSQVTSEASPTKIDCLKAPVIRSDTSMTRLVDHSFNQLPRTKGCDEPCSCICHKTHQIRVPISSRPMMGTFFVRYQGSTFFKSTCNEKNCKNERFGSLEAIYCFPHWLLDVTLIFSGRPSYGLYLPRKLGWGSSDTILKSAYEGNLKGLQLLLSSASFALHDIDQKHGRTALHYAVMRNRIEVCEFLCNASANVHAVDYAGMTPTVQAWEQILTCRGSNSEIEGLKRLFPNIEFGDDMGFTHIHMLVVGILNGNLAETLAVRDNQRKIDQPDLRGKTPLHWAATLGDFKSIEILIKFGANVAVTDELGGTPLMSAASAGCSKCLKLLLNAGSDARARKFHGSDALYNACRHQRTLPSVILLLESGATLNSQNKNGHTALIGAAIRNNFKIGKYLLCRDAAIDLKGKNGETALFEAIFHNSHQFLELLLQSSSDYTLVNNDGSTILHSTALEGDCETVKILLRSELKGLNTMHRNNSRLTATEMIHERSVIPEGFQEIFDRLLSSLTVIEDPE